MSAPRKLWDSAYQGTAIRVVRNTPRGLEVTYRQKPVVVKQKRRLTEAEDNAIGRAIRRRQNRLARPWRPYAQR